MSIASAIRANFNRHLTSGTNKFIDRVGYGLGILDDGVFRVGQYSAQLGAHAAERTSDIATEEKCTRVADAFGFGRSLTGALRVGPALHKLFTGQIFWHTNDSGWRKVACDKKTGQPIRITRDDVINGTWTQGEEGWTHKATKQTSSDGKYIDDDVNGKYLRKGWMDVLMSIFVLVARILSPIRLFHNLKTYDLGDHAKRMGGVVMGMWGAVLTLGLINDVKNLIEEVHLSHIRERVWSVFQGAIDLISLPFDFGIGSAHPVLKIVGSVLNLIAAGSHVVKEAVYYS